MGERSATHHTRKNDGWRYADPSYPGCGFPRGSGHSIAPILLRRCGPILPLSNSTTTPKARGIVRFNYALLSDICHPSAGSNLIFMSLN